MWVWQIASKTLQMLDENGNQVTKAVDDCLHYCLPSVVDTWNVALAKFVLR